MSKPRGMKEIGELDQLAETTRPDLRRFLADCRGSKFYQPAIRPPHSVHTEKQWREIHDRPLDSIRAVLKHARKGV